MSRSPTSWSSLGGKCLKVCLGNPLEAEVHPGEFCWMPSELGASPLTFRPAEGSGEEIPISSPALQRWKRDAGPLQLKKVIHHLIPWFCDPVVMISPLTWMGDECWHNCWPFLLALKVMDALSHIMGEILLEWAMGGKWLESNQETDWFFLFLPCLKGLCPSCLPFFPPFLKTHKSFFHVIHGTKWECRAGMSL